MNPTYTEKCTVTNWFWWRIIGITLLLLGIAAYFFYDWKVGYPKKNYSLVQYQTFEKARDYFMKHVEMKRTPEQWTAFAKEQPLEHYQDKNSVIPSKKSTPWPRILQDYTRYKTAYEAQGKEAQHPVLWEEYFTAQIESVEVATASVGDLTNPSKEERAILKKLTRWDLPLPTALEKGNYDANYRYLTYKTFQEVEKDFKKHLEAGKSAQEWELYSSNKTLYFPSHPEVIPSSHQEEKWPSILHDYETFYTEAKTELETGVAVKEPYLWKAFTAQNKWSQKPPENMKDSGKITEQLYFGSGCCILAIIGVIYALWMKNRFMAVDGDVFYAPGKKKILISDFTKIDKRKWATKGLATLHSKADGKAVKTRFDGLVYGGFKKEEGEPAERLLNAILKHFKGEIVEFQNEEEENPADSPPAS